VATVALVAILICIAGLFLAKSARAVGAEGAVAEHVITVHDDGSQKGFYSSAKSLRDALSQAGIRLDPRDRTEPDLDTTLDAGSYDVNIYRARPVTIRDGGGDLKVISAYRTGKQVALEAGIVLRDEDIVKLAPSQDVITDGAAEVMTIQRATPVSFDFYGKTTTAYTQAKTVGGMLQAKGIKTDSAHDKVVPSVATAITAGMNIRIWREGKQTVTQEEDVPFDTQLIKDADKDISFNEVKTSGVLGRRIVTYEIIVQDGVEVSRKEINSDVTKQPVAQVVVKGMKVNLPAGSHEDWMAAAGIAPGDYGYVNYIVNHEGGWEPCKVQGGAINCDYTGSMGYGIVQATPGGKMVSAGADWRTNPITQLKWATGYAVGRYGSWSAAYSHWTDPRYHNW